MSHKIVIEMSDKTFAQWIARKNEIKENCGYKTLSNADTMTGILAYLNAVIEQLNEKD